MSSNEFNSNLKSLLAMFAPLAQSHRDSWSGHSFRSGLSSMLEKLGFSEQQIKDWGRWKSDAYRRYLKDLSARRQVHARVTETFSAILANFK